MVGIILSIIILLAMLFDAYTTYTCIKNGKNESGKLRLFLIKLLGLKGGTYGVAIVGAAILSIPNLLYVMNPTLVFMNIVEIMFPLYAASKNLEKI